MTLGRFCCQTLLASQYTRTATMPQAGSEELGGAKPESNPCNLEQRWAQTNNTCPCHISQSRGINSPASHATAFHARLQDYHHGLPGGIACKDLIPLRVGHLPAVPLNGLPELAPVSRTGPSLTSPASGCSLNWSHLPAALQHHRSRTRKH